MPQDATPESVTEWVASRLASKRSVAVATVVARQGSAPCTPGQKLGMSRSIEDSDGRAVMQSIGTVGGGAIEHAVMLELQRVLEERDANTRMHTFRLGPSLGMCCGGSAEVLVEALAVERQVVIVGGGHVGMKTACVLEDLGFDVVLVDARAAILSDARAAGARELGVTLVVAEHDDPEVSTRLPQPARAALVVATHDHQLDQAVIEWGIRMGFGYVGGVGSRRKAVRVRERLLARGVPTSEADLVRMPVGVDIGARKPVEIAISIAAELIAWRAEKQSRKTKPKSETEPRRERDLPA